jgi:hypothetical protein
LKQQALKLEIKRTLMKKVKNGSRSRGLALLAALVMALAGAPAVDAAVNIIGTQYQPDQVFSQWDCFWHDGNYPTSCQTNNYGATVHVYVKNTGASSVAINDATLAGYSLKTVIKQSTDGGINPDLQNSIYFYWDNPPADIINAGEPVWYRFDPPTIVAGGVAQVAVRLRYIPATPTVSIGVALSDGSTLTTNITVNANAAQVASLGYSEDLRKIYIHWRRPVSSGSGAAPASVWLNGTNVTSLTTTVGDTNLNFAASVISLPNPLPFFSYHVYQGVYADGKTATASQRAWTNKFIYGAYGGFEIDCNDWIPEASAHGLNNAQIAAPCAGTTVARTYGYGYTCQDVGKLNATDPDMWFLNDEPDGEEDNQCNTHCNTGLNIPCGGGHNVGTLVIKEAINHGAEFRSHRPNVPLMVNLDNGLKPQSYFTWGPALDILQFDNYYQRRLSDAYWRFTRLIPLYRKATYIYAHARVGCAGAEPNPSNQILYLCKWKCTYEDCGANLNNIWPFPTPECRRIEVYYSLAGGSKGLSHWWFTGGSPSFGLKKDAEGAPLWKEMGLLGNEIKTARPLIVTSHPVDLPLTTSSNVWARALASGTDSLILYVVNDDYYNDFTGCHYNQISNATVTATLPSWMQSPTAFEVTPAGLRDVNTQLNGNQLQVNLGTLKLTRMIILTTNPQLRTTLQQRYDQEVRLNVCSFAPEFCTNSPPIITQQPVNRSVAPGGTTNFTVVASGSGTLGYQWRKNNVDLGNGGHYSGATSGILTISSADNNDTANYRCVVTNAFGSVTSTVVTLTVTNLPSVPTANPATGVTDTTFVANWSAATGGVGYRLDVSTNNTFGSFVSGYNNLDVGNVLSRTVSGLIGATAYYYRVRAYNDAGSSGNSGTISVTTTATTFPPGAPVAIGATVVTSNGFTANWTNAIGALAYRLDVSTANTFSSFVGGYNNLDVGNVLNRVVDGLTTGETYYYRVRGYNGAGTGGNSGTIAVTLVPANPCVPIANSDLERGFTLAGGGYIATNWTEWEGVPGVTVGYDETAIVHGGAHSQRVRVGGTNATSGGVYQRVPVIAGGVYTVGVWAYSADTASACSLGVDPAGGTNANSGVMWSSATTNVAWTQHMWTGIATANYLTIFYRVAAPDTVKRNGYFDDATPATASGPLQLLAQSDGTNLTLSWPECPGARLEQTDSLSSTPNWGTVPNEVSLIGGQKSVTLAPTETAGFFRLVLE